MDKRELTDFMSSLPEISSAIGDDGEKLCGVCEEIEPTVIARVTCNNFSYLAELCDICVVPPEGVSIEILEHIRQQFYAN